MPPLQFCRRRLWLLASVSVAVLSQAHAPALAQCASTSCAGVTDIHNSAVFAGNYSVAYGVNADGSVVVGFGVPGSGDHAFRWTPGGGMVDIHNSTLFPGNITYANGVNADGSVVVGYGRTGGSVFHAFRWTLGGGMVDIHDMTTFAGGSQAFGVNADGSVVVGVGDTGGFLSHAFRWTPGGGMVDIHNSAVFAGNYSVAYGVNADGSVAVGVGDTGSAYHAFRWTEGTGPGTGMVDIHGGDFATGINSTASGVSADGAVVVGYAYTGSISHAFRWTQGPAGMVDIHGGDFTGGNSYAFGVNADGSVVVGYGQIGGWTHAFRWTQTSGMADLNTLLANAGVNMTGIVLTSAQGISADGRFIVGYGDFSGARHAYLVRYENGIAGITDPQSVQNSINTLAQSQAQTLAQQHGFAATLLGSDKPMGLGSEAGMFASAGSFSGGGHARYAAGNGFSLLGGIAYASENYASSELKNSVVGAAAAQYVFDTGSWWRPFAEAGGWLTPNADLQFSRSYANGAGLATGVGNTRGDLSYYYGRAGILLAKTKESQLALSAEIGRERLAFDGYAEPDGPQNPFPASFQSGTDAMNLVKARVQVSQGFGAKFDGTIYGAYVHGFDRTSSLTANVLAMGIVTPNALPALDWYEYGARLGYKLTEIATLDIFANGVSGDGGIGTKLHAGAGLRVRF